MVDLAVPGHEIVGKVERLGSKVTKFGKGGRVVVNAIRKEEKDKDSLLELNYGHHLWQEKEIKSVANITRKDAQDFLPLAAQVNSTAPLFVS